MVKFEYTTEIYLLLFISAIMISITVYYFFFKKQKKNFLTNKKNIKSVKINEDFIKADGFAGYKKNYVFKNDTKGLGYYKDKL